MNNNINEDEDNTFNLFQHQIKGWSSQEMRNYKARFLSIHNLSFKMCFPSFPFISSALFLSLFLFQFFFFYKSCMNIGVNNQP